MVRSLRPRRMALPLPFLAYLRRHTAMVCVLAVGGCITAPSAHPVQTMLALAGGPLAPWEEVVGDAIENRGIARLEHIGSRWALSVMCGGTHTTYLDDTSLDLERYAETYVHARYRYVIREIDDPRCFRAPCAPVHERRIALESLTIVSVSADEAQGIDRACEG